jgi:hypothetical protein
MRTLRRVVAVAVAVAGMACGAAADVSRAPVGAQVDVTKQDGGLVSGTLSDKDAQSVTIAHGRSTTMIDRKDIADIRVIDPTKPALPPPPRARFREFTVPEGAKLRVRLETAVASDVSQVEDPVEATLTEPVIVDDREVLPAGGAVSGTVSEAQPSGKVKGRARLAVRFDNVATSGARYIIVAVASVEAPGTKGKDAEKIGLGAAGGAVVGALLGGKKGAVVGTAVGGGAGTAVVLTTPGEEIRWPVGTELSVRLEKSVDVRVPIRR